MSNTQTPRTDAAESNWWSEDGLRSAFIVRAEFARELEREIARLTAERDEMQGELRKAETESSMLRVECGVIAAERDEARREYCFAFAELTTEPTWEPPTHEQAAKLVANKRGWSCFKEDGK